MATGYTFDSQSTRRIGQTVRRMERSTSYNAIPVERHISRRYFPGETGTSGYARNFYLLVRKYTTDSPVGVVWANKNMVPGTELGTVYDPHDQFSAFGSATGLATEVVDPIDNSVRWQIVEVRMPANFVVALLNDSIPISYGTFATVTRYFGDAWNNDDPGNDVFVYNGIHTLLSAGQRVLAAKSEPDTDPVTYEVVEVLSGTGGAAMTAKLTEDVPARSGDTYGALGSVALGIPVNGVWTEMFSGTVLSPSKFDLYVYDSIYAPVTQQNGQWVLNPTELAQVTNWEPGKKMHVGQCNLEPEWYGSMPLINLEGTNCSIVMITACETLGTIDLNCGLDCESYGTGEFVTSVSCEGSNLTYETIIVRLPCGVEGT